MLIRLAFLAIVLMGLFAFFTVIHFLDDTVALQNTSGSENGILVSARLSNGVLRDQSFTSNTNSIHVGRLTPAASPNRNEVIAFTKSRPVAITQNVKWTSGSDSIPVVFVGPIQISITIWMIDAPFDAKAYCSIAASVWTEERMGVAFAPGGCDYRDAPSGADVGQFRGPDARNFDCDLDDKSTLQQAIKPIPDRINVYVVYSVDSSSGAGTGFGTTCGSSDFVALGSAALHETFVHELGHTFSLDHINRRPGFNATNFMYSVSTTRQYFTEGQIFRAHFTPLVPRHPPGSALNIVYKARPQQPTRDCVSDPCPVLEKRIWADGAGFPPN